MVIHFRPMQGSPIFGIKEIFDCGIRDWGSFSSKNPETWALESGVQLKESGIPLMIGLSGIQVPRDKESSIQYLGTGIPIQWIPESNTIWINLGFWETAHPIPLP